MSQERIDLDDLLRSGAGVPAEKPQQRKVKVTRDRIVMAGIMLDSSGSIVQRGLVNKIRAGLKLCVSSLKGVRGCDLYIDIRTFDGVLFNGMINDIPDDIAERYDAGNSSTPICAKSLAQLNDLLELQEEQIAGGINCTVAQCIQTDGEPSGDPVTPEEYAKRLVEGILVTGIGVASNERDVGMFFKLFGDMGIPKNRILTPDDSEQAIRRSMNLFSRSVSNISA